MLKTTYITIECKKCHTVHHFEVATSGYMEWLKGILIQNALPEVSKENRELLVSRICSKCFDKITNEI